MSNLFFSMHIDGNHYEIRESRFETVRAVRGFNRRRFVTRYEYRIDGKRIPKANWFAMKNAAHTAQTENTSDAGELVAGCNLRDDVNR